MIKDTQESEKTIVWKYNSLLSLASKYKLILFDLDGTLYDDSQFLIGKHTEFLKKSKLSEKKQNLIITFVKNKIKQGETYGKFIQKLEKKFSVPLDHELFITILREPITFQMELFPGIIEILDSLKNKTKIALITNGNKQQQKNKIKKLSLEKFFREEDMLFAEGTNKKPSPFMINNYLNRFKIEPDDVILIGDKNVDREAAFNANISYIDITNLREQK